jgi:ABC-type nitrate/sulfonate/bicarbonate transport system substrate-binding protein
VSSLDGRKIGVSRIGSGSYVMGYVLADQEGWLSPSRAQPFSDTVVLNNFKNLRDAVNKGDADFFMWEHFTSKKFYDSGEIRRVGEIYTPWPSWMIVASTDLTRDGSLDSRVKELFTKLDSGVAHFNANNQEAVEFIAANLEYSQSDATEWLKTVRFPQATEGVKMDIVQNCVSILRKAGVLVDGKGMGPEDMVFQP